MKKSSANNDVIMITTFNATCIHRIVVDYILVTVYDKCKKNNNVSYNYVSCSSLNAIFTDCIHFYIKIREYWYGREFD